MARNSMKIGFAIGGVREIATLLRRLPEPLRQKVIPTLMGRVGREVAVLARARAPVDTGALRRSITWVVRKGRGKDRLAYVVVGPDSSYYKSGKRIKEREAGAARPKNYAHLVEYGTTTSCAHPFLRPAFVSKGKDLPRIGAESIAAGVKKEVQRLRRRAAKRGIVIV